MATQVADGIHLVEHAYVNWYVIDDGGALTVVDTGHPRSWALLEETVRDMGRSLGDIEAVVLTHGHFDHMGFARRARTELGVRVLAPRAELDVVSHPWRYEHERSRLPYFARYPGFRRAFLAMGAAGALWVRGLEDVEPYEPNQELDVPGRPRAVATPGHTHGHCSLHLAKRSALIAGDAVVTLNPYTGQAGPQIVAGAATADSRQALASLDAIASTDAKLVLSGHGPPWNRGAEAMAEGARAAGPS
jgi:glyoxylase-like metal-dependent hydrolase (beta-lactamase superfamily II)